ncbi:MAG: corrinoid protein [Deltaproteobacteria bacterium]|nr:corrinoid protein [Deltaproteobacteria bacterium]
MDQHELLGHLKQAMVALDQDEVFSKTEMSLAQGINPLEIIQGGLMPGLNVIGEQFESEEIFLPELMKSAQIFQGAMHLLQPKIQEQGVSAEKKGTVVIGTVKGDQHYIGKNIVKLLMETSGFDVHDLGVDVDPFAFIVKAEEVQANIIALSALLTTTLVGQKDLLEALEGQGKRNKFKVIVGGGAVTQAWSDEIGADGYAENAYGAVELAKSFVE